MHIHQLIMRRRADYQLGGDIKNILADSGGLLVYIKYRRWYGLMTEQPFPDAFSIHESNPHDKMLYLLNKWLTVNNITSYKHWTGDLKALVEPMPISDEAFDWLAENMPPKMVDWTDTHKVMFRLRFAGDNS